MSSKQSEVYAIRGPIVHSISRDKVGFFENAVIVVKNGQITAFDPDGKFDVSGYNNVLNLSKGQFLCPGLIDLHIHAPQYPNIGLGMELPLLDWLTTYTFPLECKYSDVEFADRVYKYAVSTSISCGTTTAVYYGTIHCDSTVRLGHIIAELGQRTILGKVSMNRNSPIEEYVESTQQSLKEAQRFVNEINKIKSPLVQAAITPRFAITCDMQLLQSLAKMSFEQKLYIQTHISENKKEVEVVNELFPDCKDYTDVYDKAGLLTDKTILAHGIYLNDRELDTISARGTCLAHCPNSNTYLQSGLCDVRRLWKHGVKVGLGTDVSGGVNPSIVDAMRSALTTSTHLSFQKEEYKPLNYQEVFYLATLGGATALGLDNKIGNFAVGKEFDALVVDMKLYEGTAGAITQHSLKEYFQKFIYCGVNSNIKQVYVQGKLVHSLKCN